MEDYRKISAEKLGFHEYRRISAEALGYKFIKHRNKFKKSNGEWMWESSWQPDKDANQAMMIEDWLIEQGHGIEMVRWGHNDEWRVAIWEKSGRTEIGESINKSRLIAFAEAFLDYVEQTK